MFFCTNGVERRQVEIIPTVHALTRARAGDFDVSIAGDLDVQVKLIARAPVLERRTAAIGHEPSSVAPKWLPLSTVIHGAR